VSEPLQQKEGGVVPALQVLENGGLDEGLEPATSGLHPGPSPKPPQAVKMPLSGAVGTALVGSFRRLLPAISGEDAP